MPPRVERLSFDRFVEYVDLGPDVQLREVADNVDIMNPKIDRESILLYRQQIEVLSFPIFSPGYGIFCSLWSFAFDD